jgi:2-oxoisovalerate dehydrogenase E1 component
MGHWPELVIMGQDIAGYGGVFKVTEGLMEKYGSERVRNTPICESAVVGMALGLSLKGMKSIVEMQFSDFVTCAFTQIVNNLAKIYYRWGQPADVVVRMPTGAGVGAGPFHSQSTEAWFAHTPGLKVVYPSNPIDAKGLLLSSIQDPNPVMFFEHKALYRSISAEVPAGIYAIPIGKANRVGKGEDLSIITYGYGVHWAKEVLDSRPHIHADLIDLRTLLPWDKEMVTESVKKTGKALILTEDTESFGIGSELAAWIGQHLFEYLDGPVVRVSSLDTPVPFNMELEQQFLAKDRLLVALDQLFGY